MGWLIALAVLVLLAWLPLGVSAKYNSDGFFLKVIAGPFRMTLLPKQKRDKPPQKAKPANQEKSTEKKQAPPNAKENGGPITDFLPLVRTALDLLNAFRRKLRVNLLELKLIMAADDPCDLAVNYSRAWTAVGNLMPLLERCFVIKKRDVQVECDFESDKTLILARLDLTITLGRLLGILIWYGLRALKQLISIQNKRKGGKKV